MLREDMRNLPLIALFPSVLLTSTVVHANDPTASAGSDESPIRVGVGALLSSGADTTAGSVTIPIRVASVLRIEPEFVGQYLRSADKESTTWGYSFGVGLAVSWGIGPTRPLIGLRVGTTDVGSKTSTEKESDGGLLLGLLLGAEHFATSAFSIGAEARITYTAAGGGGVSAVGVLAARIYFD